MAKSPFPLIEYSEPLKREEFSVEIPCGIEINSCTCNGPPEAHQPKTERDVGLIAGIYRIARKALEEMLLSTVVASPGKCDKNGSCPAALS
jgi:hypothetical protein